MLPNRIKILLFYLLVAFTSPAFCDNDKSNLFDAHELRYREVLYHLYQLQYQTALTDLEEIRQTAPGGKLPLREETTRGELNLSYGLLDKAETIYQQLLARPGSPQIPAKNWIELAKIYYSQNSFEKSAQALSRVQGPLSEDLQTEFDQLSTDLAIQRGQKPVYSLKPDQGQSTSWQYFSQYNLGVSLIRNNHSGEGIKILDELGTTTPGNEPLNEEITALKDKANNTLGYYYLDAHDANKALNYFQKVRFNSPSTNKALLGMGWSYAELGKLNDALVPWMVLQKGDISDVSVQESLLTVPHALNALKAQRQALDQYNDAINRYKKEIQTMQSNIETIQDNGWLDSPSDNLADDANITYQKINDKMLENPYLDPLATDTQFFRSVNHYNELVSLRQTLQNGLRNISAYRSHLENRKDLVLGQMPDTLHRNYVSSMDASRDLDQLKLELNHIAQTEDALALMTKEEQHQLIVLKLVNDNIAGLSKLFNLGRLDDKLRIYRGIILWDITMEYDSRLKKAQQELTDLERNISELSRKRGEIKAVGQGKTDNIDSYQDQLASLEKRFTSALETTNYDITAQESSLRHQVITVLQQQLSHLTANLGQAYTSIAQLYEFAYLSGQKSEKQ